MTGLRPILSDNEGTIIDDNNPETPKRPIVLPIRSGDIPCASTKYLAINGSVANHQPNTQHAKGIPHLTLLYCHNSEKLVLEKQG